MDIVYEPIGVIHTPFKELSGMPIQSSGSQGTPGTVEVFPDYADGLMDIEGFSHIFLLYHFHGSQGYSLKVKPFLDDREHGVFSTRAPKRPNPIGLSVVRIADRQDNILHIIDIDVLDGTPLLDIKPYVPDFDIKEVESIGWLSDNSHRVQEARSDHRFV